MKHRNLSPLIPSPMLHELWDTSQQQLSRISNAISTEDWTPYFLTVAVAGSLARGETVADSDLDLIVVHHADVRESHLAEAYQRLWECLRPLGIAPPKPTGIYAFPVAAAALLDPTTLGKVADDPRVFGSRMSLVLEARPIWNEIGFEQVTLSLLKRYWAELGKSLTLSAWRTFLDDLNRYFKSIWLRYRWEDRDRYGAWRLRNLKAAYCRTLIWMAMLLLLAESTRIDDPVTWLHSQLALSPWERLATVFQTHGALPELSRLTSLYDTYLRARSQPDFRQQLEVTNVDLSPVACEASAVYLELARDGEAFRTGLLEFLIQHRAEWPVDFITAAWL